jgi:hypothetical protein
MAACVVCKKITFNICPECIEYHCEVHDCPIWRRRDQQAIIPVLAWWRTRSGDGLAGGGSVEEVVTEAIHHEDPRQEEQEEEHQNQYLNGAVAGLLLAAWIAYATWSERRSSGLGHERVQALKALDQFSKLLLPAESGAVTESLSVMKWRRYVFTQGFKYGVIPTPMPFPRVFASWSDVALTVRLGLFSLFANEDELARLRHMVDSARPSRALAKKAASNIVSLRSSMLGWAGSGYALGTGTYSATYSFLVSQVRIPVLKGVLNSTILSLQMPWDLAMTFNYFAVNLGKNAATLKQMSPVHYAKSMGIVRTTLMRIRNPMLALGLFTTSLAVGVTVPKVIKKYFSDKEQ